MDFSPTLERRALLKIFSLLWSGTGPCNDELLSVAENVQKLPIPPCMKEKLCEFAEETLHDQPKIYCMDSIDLSWTPQGIIDERKLVKSRIRTFSPSYSSYFLACYYCLDHEISEIWTELKQGCSIMRFKNVKTNKCNTFWTYKLDPNYLLSSGDNKLVQLAGICSSPAKVIQIAIQDGNPFLAEYLWHQIPFVEKIECLKFCLMRFEHSHDMHKRPVQRDANVFFVLSTQMDEEHLNKLLRVHTFAFLSLLLFKPYNALFLQCAEREMESLSTDELLDLLDFACLTWRYSSLFEKFWGKIPSNRKRLVLQNGFDSRFLRNLFEFKDEGRIKMILKDATSEEKEGMILSSYGVDTCKSLAVFGGWDRCKDLMTECLFSEESKSAVSSNIMKVEIFKKAAQSCASTYWGHNYSQEEEDRFKFELDQVIDLLLKRVS